MADSLKSAAKKRNTSKVRTSNFIGYKPEQDTIHPEFPTFDDGLTENQRKRLAKFEGKGSLDSVLNPNKNPLAASSTPQGIPAYSGLEQIPHGLNLPKFDVHAGMPTDLGEVGTATQTSKADADVKVKKIAEQRQTERVYQENIGLLRDRVKTGTEWRKLEGDVINYVAEGVRNEQKFINLQTEYVNRDVAGSKYLQASERLTHNGIVLEGLKGQTEHLRDEWIARKALALSKANDVEIAALKAEERVKAERASLPVSDMENL